MSRSIKIISKDIIGCILLICLSLFIFEPIADSWCKFVGVPLFGNVQSSTAYDILILFTICVFTIGCVLIVHKMSKQLWLMIGGCIILYLEFRLFGRDAETTLVPFHFPFLRMFRYVDIVPIVMLIYCLSSRPRKRKDKEVSTSESTLYFEDTTDVKDILGFENIAKILASVIKNEYSKKDTAVGIAITGEWGAGKSTFLKFLDDYLVDFTKVRFDPWTENSSDIETDMLDRIEEGIRHENKSTAKIFRHYINRINVTNVTGWFNLSVLAIRNMFWSESLEAQKVELRESLRELDKPIVIFIDDSDRLPGEQFLKTISMIRGVADLPNVVFIVAFDQSRADSILKEFGGDDFMRKLFNVVHPLRPIDNDIIANELGINISRIIDGKSDSDSEAGLQYNPFSDINIKLFLPTLREVKRFCNVVEKDYTLIKNSPAFSFMKVWQWLIVELIKYTDISTYYIIYQHPEYYLKNEINFGLNSPRYQLKDDNINVGRPETRSLIRFLFRKDIGQDNDTVQINNPRYYGFYFGEPLPTEYIQIGVIQEFSITDNDSEEIAHFKSEKFLDFIEKKKLAYDSKTNIDSIAGEILKTYPAPMLFPIVESIVLKYQSIPRIINFGEIDEKDSYRKFARIVGRHSYLSVVTLSAMEDFLEYGSHKSASDDCILKTGNPLILCALFNHHIKNWDYDGRIGSDGYLFELLFRLVDEGQHQEIVWIVGDCNSSDLQKHFLDDYLENHFLDCLPYLIWWRQYGDSTDKLIYADIKAIESLFLSHTNFTSKINKFINKDVCDSALLNELRRLVDTTNLSHRHNSFINASSYPLLSAYLLPERNILSETHLKSDTFWNGLDHIEPDVY